MVGLALCMIPEKIADSKKNFDSAKAILEKNLATAKDPKEIEDLKDILKDVAERVSIVFLLLLLLLLLLPLSIRLSSSQCRFSLD